MEVRSRIGDPQSGLNSQDAAGRRSQERLQRPPSVSEPSPPAPLDDYKESG